MEMDKATPAKTLKGLPSLKTLFTDAWEMFKGSLLNLFILSIATIVIYVVIFIVGLLVSLPLGAISLISAIQAQKLTPAFFSSLGALGLVWAVFAIIAIVVSFAIQATTILVVFNYKNNPQVIPSIKTGFRYVLPLFLASLLVGLIVMGGYFLFIIPGLLFSVFFYFVTYEVVTNNTSVLGGMRRSMGIVSENFWAVFGRILLWLVITLAISFLPNILISQLNSDALSGVWSFASAILNVLVGWYGFSYSLTLYKQAEAAAPKEREGKLLWPTVTSVLGWIIGLIFLFAIVYAITTFVVPQLQRAMKMKDAAGKLEKTPQEEYTPEMFLDLLPTDSPERAEMKRQLDAQLEEAPYNYTN